MAMNPDAAALLGSNESEPISIYRVYFDILINMEEASDPIRMSDSLDVAAGQDIREAQAKVEEFVMNSGKYGNNASEFYVTGSKRLASTEI